MRNTVIDPNPGAGIPGWLGPGAEIDGRYRIVSPLGDGGVGMVWIAEHLALHRKVAIKVLRDDVALTPTVRKRFEREAQTLASLSHPNIVTPADYGVWEGSPYLVMELLEGEPLDALLGPGKVLPRARALDITRQLLRALTYAHGRKVVHRDLKPANLFLQRVPGDSDHVKLLDFGFAKGADGSFGSAVTATGVVVGTPTYMAPEAATGVELDARADVYGAGVLLFEMLTGVRPFEGEPIEILRRRLKEDAPTMRATRADLTYPEWLHRAVAKALARAREDRFQSAADFAEALRDGTSSESVAPAAPAAPDRTPRPPWRAMGALAVIGVGAIVWTSWPTGEPVDDPSVEDVGEPGTADDRGTPESETDRGTTGDDETAATTGDDETAGTTAAPPASDVPVPPPTSEAIPPATDTVAPPASEAVPPPATETGTTATAHPDPWDTDVTAELASLRRATQRPEPPTREDIRALRTYAQAHREDPRPVLLLAHAFTRMHWMDEALETYARAFAMSDTCAGDPDVLPSLVTLAAADGTWRGAADLIAARYGADAAPVIDATLAAPDLREADRAHLEALHARLTAP